MSDELNIAFAIINTEAKEDIKKAETIEDKFKAAFKVAKNNWMFTSKETQYKAGIGAVMTNIEKHGEDYQRIEAEMKMLTTLAAAISGVSVNFPAIEEGFEVIGIQKIWEEA